MIGLDTNVLLRLFIDDDDPAQNERARLLIAQAGTEGPFLVNVVVLAEFAWTLAKPLKRPKDEIVKYLAGLIDADDLELERGSAARAALESYRTGKADFADYLLAEINVELGCDSTATFDKNALKSRRFSAVEVELVEAPVNPLEDALLMKDVPEVNLERRWSDLDVIRLLRRSNPKTGKSAIRYECYRDGMTVAEYRAEVTRRCGSSEAGKCRADLKWDCEKGFIRIQPR